MSRSLRGKLAETLKAVEAFPRTPTPSDSRFTRAEAALTGSRTSVEKVVRDSFTMPPKDYELLAELRHRCLAQGIVATKSGLLRAGLRALAQLPRQDLADTLNALESPRPGRKKAA
jgi:hypothetical protein